MDADAGKLAEVLARLDDRLQSMDRRMSAVEAGIEVCAGIGRDNAEALERILTLISAEPADGSENDLAETLRQLVAAAQANGELLGRLVLAVNHLPREIADHLASEPA